MIFLLVDGCNANVGELIGLFGYLKELCPLLIKIICAFHSENNALKHIYDKDKGIPLLTNF